MPSGSWRQWQQQTFWEIGLDWKTVLWKCRVDINESGEILTENMKIAKTFNSYFKSVTDSLELFDWPLQSNGFCDKVQNIIKGLPVILVLLKSSTNSS